MPHFRKTNHHESPFRWLDHEVVLLSIIMSLCDRPAPSYNCRAKANSHNCSLFKVSSYCWLPLQYKWNGGPVWPAATGKCGRRVAGWGITLDPDFDRCAWGVSVCQGQYPPGTTCGKILNFNYHNTRILMELFMHCMTAFHVKTNCLLFRSSD